MPRNFIKILHDAALLVRPILHSHITSFCKLNNVNKKFFKRRTNQLKSFGQTGLNLETDLVNSTYMGYRELPSTLDVGW